jgi:hypothetical protein
LNVPETLDDRFKDLLDREEIRNLVIRYANCLWRGEIDEMAAMFVEGGECVTKGNDTFNVPNAKGREQVRALIAAGVGRLGASTPLVHNHEINLESRTIANGVAFLEVRKESAGMEISALGAYHDDYEKDAGKWKFRRRAVRIYRMDV